MSYQTDNPVHLIVPHPSGNGMIEFLCRHRNSPGGYGYPVPRATDNPSRVTCKNCVRLASTRRV